MAGRHNVQNALAAIAVARELGVADDVHPQGPGRLRRREAPLHHHRRGERRRASIDDYGHHPVEIAAVLRAARAGDRRAGSSPWCSRTATRRLRDLFDEFCTCFNDADTVIVADVYPAGEAPIEGVDRDALVEGLRRTATAASLPLDGPDAAAGAWSREMARPGDLVVCLGAGDITNWAYALPGQLEAASGGSAA